MEERKKITIEDLREISELLEAQGKPEERPLLFTNVQIETFQKEGYTVDFKGMRINGYKFEFIVSLNNMA